MLLGRLTLSFCLLSLWPLRTRSGAIFFDPCLPVRPSQPPRFAPPLFILACPYLRLPALCPASGRELGQVAATRFTLSLCVFSALGHPWLDLCSSGVVRPDLRPLGHSSPGYALSLCVFGAYLASLVVAVCSVGCSQSRVPQSGLVPSFWDIRIPAVLHV